MTSPLTKTGPLIKDLEMVSENYQPVSRETSPLKQHNNGEELNSSWSGTINHFGVVT